MAAISEVLMTVLSTIREPRYGVRVHKDECVLSFSSPKSGGGLYVCMKSFLGFGSQYVDRHHAKTGQRVYLHIARTRKTPREEDGTSDLVKKKPTRLAIGVEGGFEVEQEQTQYEQHVKVVLFPDRQEVTADDLHAMPDVVREALSRSWNGILSADSASHGLQVAQWDGEERRVSRHAGGLKQLDNGVKVGAGGWRCEACDLRENLWMNLTDGKVLCGRKQYGGLDGNNHAMLHYQETKHPLAVKLGTITPDGADVHSYQEGDMVLDPKLREHLAHFGIDMTAMEKTERTITDLEIAVNQREWEAIQESGRALRPLHGPGLTGMKNLGNSCYLNSVMQVLFTVPDFQSKYVFNIDKIFDEAPTDPTQDFNTQVAKLGHGLLSGEYSKPARGPGDKSGMPDPSGDQVGIAPRMFKALVGQGHREFSTNHQQDAQEFLMHFIDMVERNRGSGPDPAEVFKFLVEERIVCQRSQKAKYTRRVDYNVQLPVPMDRATNLEELREAERSRKEAGSSSGSSSGSPPAVRAQIPFTACMEALSEPEVLTDFWSSAVRAKTTATKTTRFATFPDQLIIQVKKFTFGVDLVPKKLDVSIDVPDTLDLSQLCGTGRRPGEELLPEEEEEEAQGGETRPAVDDSIVAQLVVMEFHLEACRKAVYYTDSAGVDAAVNWLVDHTDDPDLHRPLVVPGCGGGGVSAEHLAKMVDMKFSREQAVRALRATGNTLERAVDWILNHPEEQEEQEEEQEQEDAEVLAPPPPPCRYELFAFISHMGSSTLSGHYVCHVKKEQQWVIFNDQKVCASEKPPKDLGYLYFYRRVTSDL